MHLITPYLTRGCQRLNVPGSVSVWRYACCESAADSQMRIAESNDFDTVKREPVGSGGSPMQDMQSEHSVRAAFAERLHECIREMGYSTHQQTALGRLFGVSGQAVRKWLNGHALPTAARVVPVARALGVNPSWLLHGEGAKYLHMPEDGDLKIVQVNDQEREVLEAFQRLPRSRRRAVREVIQVLLEAE